MISSSIKSNVHCYCRLRRDEAPGGPIEVLGSDLVRATNKLSRANSSFFFDRVYNSKSTQYDLFQEFEPLLNDILNGSRATIFDFGESSSGKTFTQYGTTTNPGLVYRLLEKLTDLSMRIVCRLRLSMAEVVDSDVFDLLAPAYKRLRTVGGRPDGASLTALEIATPMDLLKHLDQGRKARAQAHSSSSSSSSPPSSHLVVSYYVEVQERKEIVKKGTLNFVDLAGSELINYSIPPTSVQTTLQALGAVIRSFDARDPVISAASESPLLQLLGESLQCNHQLIMIYNIDPSAEHALETVKTLQFHHDSRREFNYLHLIQFLEKENSLLQQQVTTLKLENGMMARQASVGVIPRLSLNSGGLSVAGASGSLQKPPPSPNHTLARINSMDRINPMSPTFVPNASRRGNSVSIPSMIPRTSPYKSGGGGFSPALLTVTEIKQGLSRATSSARGPRSEGAGHLMEMGVPLEMPSSAPRSARNASSSGSAGATGSTKSGAFSNLRVGGARSQPLGGGVGGKRTVRGKSSAAGGKRVGCAARGPTSGLGAGRSHAKGPSAVVASSAASSSTLKSAVSKRSASSAWVLPSSSSSNSSSAAAAAGSGRRNPGLGLGPSFLKGIHPMMQYRE